MGDTEAFQSLEVTVLLADLRGFTSVSATRPVGVVLDMLDRYLVRMSEVIVRNNGTIDKFMGDSIMVLFGAPMTRADDVQRALRCAVEMQQAMLALNEQHRRAGLPDLYMGIGINTGTVMAGVLGSELYSEYTVIGREVNLAARIEAFSLRGQILVSEATFERSDGFVTASVPMEVWVKGSPEPVCLREVIRIPSLGLEVPRQEVRRSPRVAARIPLSYQMMENKIVMPVSRDGTIVDISYDGVLAELVEDLASRSDIKLDLDLSVIGARATEIYAKAVRTVEQDGRRLTGIEFTSVGPEDESHIKRFVQLLLQGSETR